MGRLYREEDLEQAAVILNVPLLDTEFDESLYSIGEYERTLLATMQPHHGTPSTTRSS